MLPFSIEERNTFLSFFQGITLGEDGKRIDSEDREEKEKVFSASDIDRMLALQYIMTLIATIELEEYFPRNDKIQSFIEKYNEDFYTSDKIKDKLLDSIGLINKIDLDRKSIWFNKANLFTLLVELAKIEQSIDLGCLKNTLINFDSKIRLGENMLDAAEIKYMNYSREAVNEKPAREFRGNYIQDMISPCINQN